MKSLVLAISGGVDSMVLLDMLARQSKDQRLTVAHVNHGIRSDSDCDESLVATAAKRYGLDFYSTKLDLGPFSSEDLARQKRYAWLNRVKSELKADAVVMAHHQDDVIETVIINLMRGTGWRGLVSLRSHPGLIRPLLRKSKSELVQYAIAHQLEWREDSTNDDPRLLRNYIRMVLVPRLSSTQRQSLISVYESQLKLSPSIEQETEYLLDRARQGGALSRYFLTMLPATVSYEIIRLWLGKSLTGFQRKRLIHFVATARPGSVIELESGCSLQATIDMLVVYP